MSLYEKVIYIDLPYGANTIPISQAYPYQSIGIVMVIGGIIMIVIGAVMWNDKSEMKRKKIHFVSVENVAPNQSGYYCRYCGFQNPKDSVCCKRCGKKIL
jgi:hypothetical protein